MQKFRMQGVVLLLCGGLLLAAGAQKREKPENENSKAAPVEHDKAVVRGVFDDVLSKKRYDMIDLLYDPKCIVHQGHKTMSLSDAVADGKQWVAAAPDMTVSADRMEAEGDRVKVRWTARGKNTGEGHGLSASGKPVVVHGSSTFRLAGGKITEIWNDFNEQEIFKQVGEGHKKHRQ